MTKAQEKAAAKKAAKEEAGAPAQTKRRITKPGGFANLEGYGRVEEGAEVTDAMRKAWDAFQYKCQSNININDYTS